MRLAPLYLTLAIVLLWLPLALVLGRRRRHELRNPARSDQVTLPSLLACVWSWLDLARAAGGTWLLLNKTVLPATAPLRPLDVALSMAVQLVPLIPAVWIQVMLTGSRRLRVAPLFFLLGIAGVLLPWQVSVFGIALAFTLTGMLQRWPAIFWIMPACLAGIAALFRSINLATLLTPLLFILPGLLGVRPERPLSWVIARSWAWDPQRRSSRDHGRRRRSDRSASPVAGGSAPTPATVPHAKPTGRA